MNRTRNRKLHLNIMLILQMNNKQVHEEEEKSVQICTYQFKNELAMNGQCGSQKQLCCYKTGILSYGRGENVNLPCLSSLWSRPG